MELELRRWRNVHFTKPLAYVYHFRNIHGNADLYRSWRM
jgi:hypothetical protein